MIEVKSCNAAAKGLRKDLRTLRLFHRKVRYRRAIYLIHGSRAESAATRVKRFLAKEPFPELELWVHREPRTPAVRLAG